MAVRQFDGVDDDIRHAIGALAGMQYGTFAALVKVQAPTGDYGSILSLFTSGNVLRVQWYYDETVEWHNIFVPNRSTTVDLLNYENQWALLIARKASGNVPVTFSLYRFNQGQWTHGNSSNFANWTSPGANGIVARSLDGDEHFRGLIAVQAVWANRVPFANNTAVENAGLHQSLDAWFDAEPDALWAFNQESVADPVNDLTGNGADQIARTGTAVVIGDDPPGFDWGDEPAIVGSGEATLPAVAGSGSGAVRVEGSGQAVLPAHAAEGVGAVLVEGSGQAALPAYAGEGAGAALVEGSGEATIPPFTAQGAGAALIEGSGQAALPAYAGEGAGAVSVEGAGESALPAIAASGDGTVYTPTVKAGAGFGAPLWGVPTFGGASFIVEGSGEAALPGIVAEGVGVVVDTGITGSGEATIPPFTAEGAGAVSVEGSGEAALPAYAGEGAGAVLIEGVGEAAFAAFVADGAGDVLVIGSGEATISPLTAEGAGIIYSPGAGFGIPLWGVPTFGGAALADTGEAGYGAATIPPLTAHGAGAVLVEGFGEATVPALVAAGYGFQGEAPEHRAGSEQTVLRRRGFSTTALRS